MDGRFAWPLGGQHAGDRHDEFHRRTELPWIRREPASGRTPHARGRRYDRLSVYGDGSDDMAETLDGRVSADENPGSAVRIRVSRRELPEHERHAERSARPGGASEV